VLSPGEWGSPGPAALLVALTWLTLEGGPPCAAAFKGGDVALSLVGELHGADATHFAQHERFKLRVTCPPTLTGSLRAAVYQGGVRYEPLSGGGLDHCGNRVAWHGAFTLDGHARAWVCVRWDGGAWPAMAPHGERRSSCLAVDPAR
jgi:hypothetical protein